MTNARTAYREADVRGASGARLVVLLYEQAIQDLRQAAQAMDENKIELRTNYINHALEIIGRLEGTLDMERGGQVARNLEGFYKTLRANLWKAQLHKSKEILLRQITDLFALREAWTEVDRAESGSTVPKVAPSPIAGASRPHAEQSVERVPTSWNA
jgi:flagellar protein FliS